MLEQEEGELAKDLTGVETRVSSLSSMLFGVRLSLFVDFKAPSDWILQLECYIILGG